MSTDIKDILSHTNIFKNAIFDGNIEKISSSKTKVLVDGKNYVLSLYDLKDYDKIENESYVNEILNNAGLNPLKIYDKGILADLEKSYKVYEYRDEISLKDYLKDASIEDQKLIGFKLGEALKKLHCIKPTEKIDWQKEFLIKSNNIFYIHGLASIGDDDYVLTDFINANKYLTENTAINLLYKNISEKNIRVYNNNKLDLRAIKELEYGDGTIDFLEINRLAINYPQFSKAVLDGYSYYNKPGRKFFRLLSLYQATLLLENLVYLRRGEKSQLSYEEVKSILSMYDNFNKIIPDWAE